VDRNKELQQVSDHFVMCGMKTGLGDFTAEVRRNNIFKPSQTSRCRPTPQTARSLGSVGNNLCAADNSLSVGFIVIRLIGIHGEQQTVGK
jgi:hypothetical protein